MHSSDLNSNLPAPYQPVQPPAPLPPGWDVEVEAVSVPLSHYLWVLRRHRWRIAAFIAACLALTLIVSYRLTPIYESTATIDVDRRMPTLILGEESVQSTNNDADQFLATQIKLIQSDSVLRPVAEKYDLREREDEDWKEAIDQDPEAGETPVILKKLKVTRPPNTYLLLLSYRSKDKKLAADVANGIAQSYLEHTYNIRYRAASGLSQFMERQQEELRAKMERSSEALAKFERELNVINPEEKTNILSARLVQLNSEYTNAQAERVRKEAAFGAMKQNSPEAAYISSQSEALEKLTESYNAARQHFADIKSRFGANHPEHRRAVAQVEETRRLLDQTKKNIVERVEIEYRQAMDREKMLGESLAETKAEFDRLNSRSFEYQTLKREADADKKLYEELVRKIKEAGINASFQNSSIRIADAARPGLKPVFPNIKLNLAVALLLAMMFAVGAALLTDTLDDTIRDPEQAFRSLRTPVVGTLPQVKPWRTQLATIDHDGAGPGEKARSLSTYEEAIRTLRNSILLSDFDRDFKTLLVTSASPSEGKSTIAIHLAVAHAQQRHRTLIIDGDLRRPSIHKRFGMTGSAGLSDVLTGRAQWRDVLVRPEGIADLDVLPAGTVSRRAADLIGRGLQIILDEASREYDLIILDAPPLLGFPEPLQMAASADGVVIVARAGRTSRKGVASVIATLQRLRSHIVGIVLNEVHKEISDSYYYYGYYGKYYKHYRSSGSNDLVTRS
jgi:capsular exopolysaccharide synthesis family protein